MSWNSSTHIMESINIGWGDISQATGVAGPPFAMGDMVRDSVILNKWARYKPIRSSSLDYSHQLNSAKTAWDNTVQSPWWKGPDGKCGLDIQVFTDLGEATDSGDFFYDLVNGLLGWEYIKPTGTALSPFRPLDLFKYNGDAEPIVEDFDGSDIWLDLFGNFSLSYGVNNNDDLSLKIGDFRIGGLDITDFYIGVLLFNGTTQWFATSDTKIPANASSIDISFSGASFLAGVWTIVPFLSSVQYELGDDADEGIYASCFDIPPRQFTIHAPGTTVLFYADGTWNPNHTSVTYSVEVENQSSNSYTLTIELDMRKTDILDVDPATGGKITTPSVGTYTIAAGETRTFTGTFNVSNYDSSKFYFIKGYADGFGGSQYNQLEEEVPPPEEI